MMWFTCTDNDGFEDQLTPGHMYQGRIQGGSIKMVNDNGDWRWYGNAKFKPLDME